MELELQKFKEIEALRKQFDEERKAIRGDCNSEIALLREQNKSGVSRGSLSERGSQVTGELQECEVVDLVPEPMAPLEGIAIVPGGGLSTVLETLPVEDGRDLVEETQEANQQPLPVRGDSPQVSGCFLMLLWQIRKTLLHHVWRTEVLWGQ